MPPEEIQEIKRVSALVRALSRDYLAIISRYFFDIRENQPQKREFCAGRG